MHDAEYAYSTACIREAENRLLSMSFMEQLIDADSYTTALQMLSDKGFEIKGGLEQALLEYKQAAWDFLLDVVPDKEELSFLIVTHDYHNLKAILKSMISNKEPDLYYLSPALTDPQLLYAAVKNHRFDDDIRPFLSQTISYGYELLTETLDGQLVDLYLDKQALVEMKMLSEQAKSEVVRNYTDAYIAVANMRIALRLSKSQRDCSLNGGIFCPCELIDIDKLTMQMGKSQAQVLEYFENTELKELCAAYQSSVATFEKKCDDYLLSLLEDAKLSSFGIEPAIAYYCAVQTQLKVIRIIMNGKSIHLPTEKISERVRNLYV